MKILVLGAGRVGLQVSRALENEYDICIADRDENRLEKVKGDIKKIRLDASEHWTLVKEMERYDGIVNALPDSLSLWVIRAAVKAKKKVVDVSIPEEIPEYLRGEAKRRGSQVLMDAAFFPGLSNFLLKALLEKSGGASGAEIRGGEIPRVPRPPTFHEVDYFGRLVQTLKEYSRPARAIVKGKLTSLDSLSSRKISLFESTLEEAPVDRLRSLLNLNLDHLVAYSLRWPGHFERMRILRDLGFLSEENILKTAEVLSPHMIGKEELALLEVKVISQGEALTYEIFAESSDGPSGAEMAGISASIFSRLFFSMDLPPGLYFPEDVFFGEEILKKVISSLKGYGVKVSEKKSQEVIASG